MKTCIAGIIAPFDIPYCREWIEYHMLLGIDEFILTLNDFSEEQETQIRRLIDSIDGARVRLLKMDGPRMQVPSYNQMLAIAYSLGADWCGFFDLDEFIKVRSTRKLKDILSDFGQYPQLSFNWRIYGSNGIEKVEEVYDPDPLDVTDRYSVQERFTKCQATLNIHVKQMINLSWFRE